MPDALNDWEFYERAIHTDISEVPGLRDRTAGQMLLKMAALAGGKETELRVRFTAGLGLEVVTPLGVYTFILDQDDRLTVEQVA